MGYDSTDRDDGTIARCPFCHGEAYLKAYDTPRYFTNAGFQKSVRMYMVVCGMCCAQGPRCEKVTDALDLWNKSENRNDGEMK